MTGLLDRVKYAYEMITPFKRTSGNKRFAGDPVEQEVISLDRETVDQIDTGNRKGGGFLERTKNFFSGPKWNQAKVVDLSKTDKLPETPEFKLPEDIKTVQVHYTEKDKGADSILNDKRIQESIPQDREVKAQFLITRKDIYKLIETDPSKLTIDMAEMILGDKSSGVKGLDDDSIAKILKRFDTKFQDNMPTQAVLKKLMSGMRYKENSAWQKVQSYENVMRHAGYTREIEKADDRRSAKERTASAVELSQANIEEDLRRLGVPTLFFEAEIAEKIHQECVQSIQWRRKGIGSDSNNGAFDYLMERLNKSIGFDGHDDKYKKVILRALARLETMFENGGNRSSADYKRITNFMAKDKEQTYLYGEMSLKRGNLR